MIKISTNKKLIDPDGWDFSPEEIDYLLEEHDGETYVYSEGRLFETACEKEEV